MQRNTSGSGRNAVKDGATGPAETKVGSDPTGESGVADGPHHDILFVSHQGQYFRFPVNKEGNAGTEGGAAKEEDAGRPGTYRCPVEPPYSAAGTRHARNSAAANDEGPRRGPIFATLPITPEPGAASTITCYVINAQNLRYENPYIVEEWTSAGAGERSLEMPDGFTLLVAGPKGEIYLFSVDASGPRVRALSDAELKVETDIWQSLRNGMVVGRVLYGDSVVPLVNVTSALVDERR
jgi:hypothetical protein